MGVLIAVHVPPNLVNLLIPRHFKKHTGLVVFWAMLRKHCSDAEFVNLPDRPAIRLDSSAASFRLEAQWQRKIRCLGRGLPAGRRETRRIGPSIVTVPGGCE
jgi:hypothetical protein